MAKPGAVSWLWRRQLNTYPESGRRVFYLALTVLATITLYYELYVAGAVSPLLLAKFNMSFTFFVVTLAFGNLIGAFGSLFAGLTDRVGRTNMVVGGLIITGIFVAFILPAAPNKWAFVIEGWAVGAVEGICLVATPALIRDFSPQVGRASAMGFWTSGPVVGSLVVAVVASHTIGVNPSPSFWTHEYHICGIAGLVVAAIALVGMRELSPQLRDQLMVTMHDRALIEARAKGLDVEAALRNPWRQLLKPDIVVSALGISIFLLVYYTAVGFGLIYFTTVFGFSVKDGNGLGNWNWGLNVIAVILFGIISDRVRVRKPFMLVGGAAAAVMLVLYLEQAGHGATTSYYHLAILVGILSFCLGVAYVPWMASYTETVEAHNPALTATGLAIWGWILRVIVFVSFLIIPVVITSVTPLVSYGGSIATWAAGSPRYHVAPQYPALAWAGAHPQVVATATKYKAQLVDAQKLAPELAVIQKNPVLFAKLSSYSNPAQIPPALIAQAVAAAGGGAHGQAILGQIAANKAAIQSVIAAGPQLQSLAPYATELTALSKVPPSVIAYVGAHGAKVAAAAKNGPGEWKDWYWICFAGMILFLLTVPVMRGRWSPAKARADEEAHEAMVQAELARMSHVGA